LRYEYRGGGSNKYWEIFKPLTINDDWVVDVIFGRIGTSGQSHRKIFASKWRADHYHDSKVEEKLRKGYHVTGVQGAKMAPKPAPKYINLGPQPPLSVQALTSLADPKFVQPAPKACEHVTLSRKGGNTWECASCKHKVEFDKAPQAVDAAKPEFETRVRRFFASAS